ncbi:MAG TPA: glycosyltransferase family 4 protein [Vicinamibacterales bacterium]|jgi:glycosyltransferase involved in cell wall biosynthesis
MRVALVSFDFGEYSVRLASGLSRAADVTLLVPWPVVEPHLKALDPRVYLQPFVKPRLRQPGRQIRMCLELVRRIKAFQPDVVHVQHGHLWFNFFLPLLRRYALVLTVHDARHHIGDKVSKKTPQSVMDFGFRWASRLIVHVSYVKRVIADECGIPEAGIDVVPHISLGSAFASVPVREREPTILFFGRIWEYKGLEYLIRAEPFITREVPDAKIVIAGHGDDFDRYRRQMVNVDRFVVHNEHISEERRAELFRHASVVVLPYIEASQSGVVPLAYAWAKPVVATTVGGLPEMIDDGVTGYLVPPRDERALAAASVRLLRDERLRRELGMNGKRRLDRECRPGVIAEQTLASYRQALLPRRYGLRSVAAGRGGIS